MSPPLPISPHRRSSPKLMLAGNTPRSRPQTARERSFAPASTPAWRNAPRPWSAPSNLSTPTGRSPPPLLTTPTKRPQPPRPPEETKPSRYLRYAPGQVFLFFHCASGRESGGEGVWVLGVVDESGQKLKRATSKLGEPIRTYPLTIDGANQSVYPWPRREKLDSALQAVKQAAHDAKVLARIGRHLQQQYPKVREGEDDNPPQIE